MFLVFLVFFLKFVNRKLLCNFGSTWVLVLPLRGRSILSAAAFWKQLGCLTPTASCMNSQTCCLRLIHRSQMCLFVPQQLLCLQN